jgi:hypothetical protein
VVLMGAWGVLAFDNDDANDWSYGLEKVNDLSLVVAALSAAANSTGFLDAHEGCEALAACEVVARLRGNPGYRNPYTEVMDKWVKEHPSPPSTQLVEQALQAIDRVQGEGSELRELWDGQPRWLDALEDLRQRLQGQASSGARMD